MNKKFIMYTSIILGAAAVGYFFYEKQRVKKLDAKVESLQQALAKLQQVQ
jgi:hypothetical protein